MNNTIYGSIVFMPNLEVSTKLFLSKEKRQEYLNLYEINEYREFEYTTDSDDDFDYTQESI